MDKLKYQNIVSNNTPKEPVIYNAIIAFLTGGTIGCIGEVLVNIYSYYFNIPTSQASIFMIVTMIFLGCLFTCLGFFDKWVHVCKCGLIVPITGFAHATMSAALEYRKEGIVTGIGANMFKLSGTVIVCGVTSAYVFGLIRYLLFRG